ncbi:hypothetical protein Hanom_Chr06g00552541 [Helianthus anomalus]
MMIILLMTVMIQFIFGSISGVLLQLWTLVQFGSRSDSSSEIGFGQTWSEMVQGSQQQVNNFGSSQLSELARSTQRVGSVNSAGQTQLRF